MLRTPSQGIYERSPPLTLNTKTILTSQCECKKCQTAFKSIQNLLFNRLTAVGTL